MSENLCMHLTLHGRVQGVGYRSWTQKEAVRRGISGWVRNRGDGTVEAMLYGPPEAVQAMCEACRKGPLLAKVKKLESRAINAPEGYTEFKLLPTV